MHARVSTFEGPSAQSDDDIAQAVKVAQEQVVPAARRMDGFEGVLFLIDRATGKSISATLWKSQGALRASEEAANRLRKESAQASGETIAGVERFEVANFEVGRDVLVSGPGE